MPLHPDYKRRRRPDGGPPRACAVAALGTFPGYSSRCHVLLGQPCPATSPFPPLFLISFLKDFEATSHSSTGTHCLWDASHVLFIAPTSTLQVWSPFKEALAEARRPAGASQGHALSTGICSSESITPFMPLPLIGVSNRPPDPDPKTETSLVAPDTPHPSGFCLPACHSFHRSPSHFSLNWDKRARCCQGLGENPTRREPAPSWPRDVTPSAEPRTTTVKPGRG